MPGAPEYFPEPTRAIAIGQETAVTPKTVKRGFAFGAIGTASDPPQDAAAIVGGKVTPITASVIDHIKRAASVANTTKTAMPITPSPNKSSQKPSQKLETVAQKSQRLFLNDAVNNVGIPGVLVSMRVISMTHTTQPSSNQALLQAHNPSTSAPPKTSTQDPKTEDSAQAPKTPTTETPLTASRQSIPQAKLSADEGATTLSATKAQTTAEAPKTATPSTTPLPSTPQAKLSDVAIPLPASTKQSATTDAPKPEASKTSPPVTPLPDHLPPQKTHPPMSTPAVSTPALESKLTAEQKAESLGMLKCAGLTSDISINATRKYLRHQLEKNEMATNGKEKALTEEDFNSRFNAVVSQLKNKEQTNRKTPLGEIEKLFLDFINKLSVNIDLKEKIRTQVLKFL